MTARARPSSAPEVPPICAAIEKAWMNAGVTQHELARRVKVGQSMVARWTVDKEPSLDMVAALEEALELPRGFLLRAAGYVTDGRLSVARAVENDPALDARGRKVLLATYRALVGKRS